MFEVRDKLKEWQNYFTNLFDDNGNTAPPSIAHFNGPLITRSEVVKTDKHQKAAKQWVLMTFQVKCTNV